MGNELYSPRKRDSLSKIPHKLSKLFWLFQVSNHY